MNQRPTFGVTTQNNSTNSDTKEKREELGAIWSRTSTKSDFKFFSIKMTLTKEMLKQLSESTSEEVSLNLVAFPNKNKDGVSARPDYRIYEEKKKV